MTIKSGLVFKKSPKIVEILLVSVEIVQKDVM